MNPCLSAFQVASIHRDFGCPCAKICAVILVLIIGKLEGIASLGRPFKLHKPTTTFLRVLEHVVDPIAVPFFLGSC
jgi:hypothetical protein